MCIRDRHNTAQALGALGTNHARDGLARHHVNHGLARLKGLSLIHILLQRELGQLFTFAPSGNAWIDAMQPGVSKASGIAQLMEHYGVCLLYTS